MSLFDRLEKEAAEKPFGELVEQLVEVDKKIRLRNETGIWLGSWLDQRERLVRALVRKGAVVYRDSANNIIDVEDRDTLKATVGLRGEGSFMWRVAAFGSEGIMGPWSAPRGFRVASRREPTTG